MIRSLFTALILSIGSAAFAQDNPVVVMETTKGTIRIELWADKAPVSVEIFSGIQITNFMMA